MLGCLEGWMLGRSAAEWLGKWFGTGRRTL